MKYKLLIVDDNIEVIHSIIRMIDRHKFDLHYTTVPEQAFDILRHGDVDILLCDQRMPDISGIELMNYAKNMSPGTVRILMTAYTDSKALISAVNEGNIFSYLEKPWSYEELIGKLEDAITWKLKQEEKSNQYNNLLLEWVTLANDLQKKLDESKRKVFCMLLKIMEERDIELYRHCLNTMRYAMMLADLMGISQERKEDLKYAALVHDIGKVTIKDKIIYKPGSLSRDEACDMKKHAEIGAEIVDVLGYEGIIADIIRQHHEWFDGSGYPMGIKGDEILTEAKILAIADTYDALTSDRVYRVAMKEEEALCIMYKENKTHFDPYILEVFSRGIKNDKEYSFCG